MKKSFKYVQTFWHNPEEQGIIQNYYYSEPNFIKLKGSSSSSNDETSILSFEDNIFWQSEDTPNSFFIVSFASNRVLLNSFSLLSCRIGQCVYSLIVLGANCKNDDNCLNNENIWEEICSVNKSVDYFKTNVSNAECCSEKSYSSFKFIHNGINDRGKYLFPIHYLELFGNFESLRKPSFNIPRILSYFPLVSIFLIY